MRRLLIAGLVFGCSATGAGPLPGREVARANAPRTSTPAPTAASNTGQVIVDVYGLKDERGKLNVGIYIAEGGFPKDSSAAFAQRTVPINNRALRLVFDGIPAGEFAVAVHHDENSNGKMDTGAFGRPSEGYGFSRDAEANFGPPSYEAARLKLAPGQRLRVAVHMNDYSGDETAKPRRRQKLSQLASSAAWRSISPTPLPGALERDLDADGGVVGDAGPHGHAAEVHAHLRTGGELTHADAAREPASRSRG